MYRKPYRTYDVKVGDFLRELYTKKGKNIDPPLPYSIMRMTCSRCLIIANDMSGNARTIGLIRL